MIQELVLDVPAFLVASVWFYFRTRTKEKKAGSRTAFGWILYLAGILLIWGLCASLMNEIFVRRVLNFSILDINGNPYGETRIFTGILRSAMDLAWSWFLSGLLGKEKIGRVYKTQYVIFLALPIFSLVFLASFLILSDYYASLNGYALVMINIILLFLMNVFVVYFYRAVAKGYETEKKYRLHKQREELVYQHYQKLEESYQQFRKIVHDVKNHMQAVIRLYEDGQPQEARRYGEEVFHLLNQGQHSWYTGNRMLNIILNEKLCHPNLKDAALVLDIEEGCLDRIEEIDITTIFANLLDNAIEAMETPSVKGEKYLSVRAKEVKEFLMIEIVNTKGSKRKSSKEHQGLGIGNVKEAIKKYDGTCTIQEEKEKFQVILLLPKTGKEGPLR